ncbi:VWA domain-containing protein [Myxococcota bacterium]|nr:VWA domain-containing protein [Myxococcota bacterium]MBU1381863.1 VWA domain-containing protein [Myxococcota bacterium]MBU1495598.1 VWA domain-containing protein [Myxococcota bacterium]
MTWRNWDSFLTIKGIGFWLAAGLIVMIFIYVLGHAIKKNTLAKLGDDDLVKRLFEGRSQAVGTIRIILLMLSMTLLVVAWAQPQTRGKSMNLKPRGLDIVVALDFSKSMNVRDMHGSRLEHAKREMNKLIDNLGGDRVGLVAFAGTSMTYPLTEDYESAKMFWENLRPEDMPLGGTAIGRALVSARDLLIESRRENDERSQIIILLSDGEDLAGQAEKIAGELNQKGIKIFSVGIGSKSGSLVPMLDENGKASGYMKHGEKYVTSSLDEKTLKSLASATGGKFFSATRTNFGTMEVLKAIKDLKRTEGKKRKIEEKNEEFYWFLIPAVLLLLMELALLGNRRLFGKAVQHES